MTWLRRRSTLAVVVLGAVIVSSGLSGCAALLAEPPASVSAAADSATAAVGAAPGVESVTADVTIRDYQGEGSWSEPEAWVVHIRVKAVPGGLDLERAADEVVIALEEAPSAVQMDAVVTVPHIDGAADAEIHFGEHGDVDGSAAERVQAARDLAGVDGVSRVTVGRGDDDPRVETAALEEWTGVAEGVRRIPGFGSGALGNPSLIAPLASGESWSGDGTDGLYVELGTLSPSPDMIDELTRLGAESSVRSIAFSSGEGPFADGAATERSSLQVGVETSAEAQALAARLADLDDPRYWAQGSGRPFFEVAPPPGAQDADGSAVVGYVGLPLGSPEPDDLPADLGDIAHSILFSS
jgi:hypothetical protein